MMRGQYETWAHQMLGFPLQVHCGPQGITKTWEGSRLNWPLAVSAVERIYANSVACFCVDYEWENLGRQFGPMVMWGWSPFPLLRHVPQMSKVLVWKFYLVCRSWDLVTLFSTVTRVPPHYLCCWDMCWQILDLFPMLWGWNCIIAKVLGLTANLSKDMRLVLQSFNLNTIGNNLHSALEIKWVKISKEQFDLDEFWVHTEQKAGMAVIHLKNYCLSFFFFF